MSSPHYAPKVSAHSVVPSEKSTTPSRLDVRLNELVLSHQQLQTTGKILVTVMPDDSNSIRIYGNTNAIMSGHNSMLEKLQRSPRVEDILFCTRYLNGKLLNSYCPVREAVPMDRKNYEPNYGTPLYDQSRTTLQSVEGKKQELRQRGIPSISASLLLTDGYDEYSVSAHPQDVEQVVKRLMSDNQNVVVGLGVKDGRKTDYFQVFRSMGIPEHLIDELPREDEGIRTGFDDFGGSVVDASSQQDFSGSFSTGFTTRRSRRKLP